MKRVLVAGLTLVVALLVGKVWWDISLRPVDPADKTSRVFVVDKGAGVREIARRLKEERLIRDQVAFFLLVKTTGLERKIQAGDFRLSPSMSSPQVAEGLTHGTLDVWVTIPEGWRSEQIVAELVRSQALASPDGELALFAPYEGRLFPDTYLIPRGANGPQILKIFLDNFSARVTDKMIADARARGLTLDQVLILASLVEREGKTDADRPIIADILLKRLKEGIALQVDASVQYAVALPNVDNWWKKDLTVDDLKVRSPFNTYTNPGLPPHPVCNPGLAAINAVIYPAATPYYYYMSDKNGVTHYAKTLEEHNANVAKYL